jgi:hypothetical protein
VNEEDKGPAVIIVGAGVAGMTAAHELAERGFDVHVIEREVDAEAPDLPDVGGAARTQWWHPPQATDRDDNDAVHPWLPREQTLVLCEGPLDPDLDLRKAEFTTIFDSPRTAERLRLLLNLIDEANPAGTNRSAFHLQVWHRTARHAHDWWDHRGVGQDGSETTRGRYIRELVLFGAKTALDNMAPNGRYRRQLEKLLTVDRSLIDGYGYGSIELESHSPDRARFVLIVRPTQPLAADLVRIGITDLVGPRAALPGEHGYRFFPSFYNNVFDTMRRIPVLRSARREVRTPDDDVFDVYRTVLDNLRPVERHAFAFPGKRGPINLDRRRARSLRDALRLWRVFQQELGFSLRDILLYQVCLLRFLSSGEARRKEVEAETWNNYVGAERFSARFREALQGWSLALGGLRGDEADARTFGAVALQFILDQLEDRNVVDGTLNGPTSQAWFQPWRRMLARERTLPGSVTFHRDQVRSLTLHPTGPLKEAQEVRVVCRDNLTYQDAPPAGDRRRLPPGATLILATQPHEALRLLKGLKEDHRDPQGAHRFDRSGRLENGLFKMLSSEKGEPFHPNQLREPSPAGPLRHFVGVQFFLRSTAAITDGHIYLPESAWGLTAIGQSQFRASREGGRRGVISVDIGAAYLRRGADGQITDKPTTSGVGEAQTFWASTREQAVQTIWDTLRDAVSGGPIDLPVEPPVHTVDRSIVWGDPTEGGLPTWLTASEPRYTEAWLWDQSPIGPREPNLPEPTDRPLYNNHPYLITTAGRFHERPGAVDPRDPTRGYDPIDLNVFVAGAYTQTFTRIVTMESACESARHVVNGILRQQAEQARRAGKPIDVAERCRVFNPEDLEPGDLSYWKELDDRLHAAGLPHLLDILKVEAWLEELLPVDEAEPGAQEPLIERFDRLVDVFEPDGEGVRKLIRWAGAKSLGLLGLALRILGR